ncbi:MAG: hypothetical protein O3B13_11875 [Planctomycetota bacterium]|nr:hypothetical protein [Planctomycetota bacterium]
MRLLTAVCLSLTLLGIVSGCAMTGNPLASKTDPQDASRRRLITEMNARTEKGDIAGARRILAQLEASDKADDDDSSVTALESSNSSTTASDVDRMVDRLVAFDPPALRESNRAKYEKFSPAALRLMLTEYERTAEIGQPGLNQVSPNLAVSEQMYAQNSPTGTTGPTGQSASGNHQSAPDPRRGENQQLGTQSPWTEDRLESSSQLADAARDIPNENISGASGTGSPTLGEGLQTVSAEMPSGGTIAGAGPTLIHHNPFPEASQHPVQQANELPVVSPGNTGLQRQVTQTAASFQARNTGPAANSGSGGVALGNQILPADDTLVLPLGVPAAGNTASVLQPGVAERFPQQLSDSAGQNDPELNNPAGSPSVLPGVLGSSVQGVQQNLSRIKDAAGRTIRNFSQGTPQLNTSATGLTSGTADVHGLIRTLETELLAAAPGQTDAERMQYIRQHVNLRMLHLVAGDVSQAIEPIPNIDAADQEFWQQMLWSVSNYFDDRNNPEASVRTAETIEQLRGAIAQLSQTADLKLRNTTFCHRIVSFGNYDRFKVDRFTTGQPVLLYSEIENFTSLRSNNDGYRTALQSTIELYRSNDLKQPLESIPFETTEDFCRAQRRDYFHSYEFAIPQQLEPGQYTLMLRVVDQQSRKVATSKVNFEVE